MKVKLVVVQGKPEGLQIPIPGPTFSIGRDPKCNLRPNNELVSKVHCTFVIEGETILLEDKGSTNGTFVNNERLQGKREVKDGDLIKVGSLVFALSAALPQPAAVAAKPQQDDDAMQWLLGDAEGKEPGDENTVFDVQVPAAGSEAETVEMKNPISETVADMPLDKPAPAKQPAAADPNKKYGDTHEAANAILKGYMFRKRT